MTSMSWVGAEASEVFVGGGGGGVSELVGDRAERYAGVAEVDREGVTQSVRVNPLLQAGGVGEPGQGCADVRAGKSVTSCTTPHGPVRGGLRSVCEKCGSAKASS